MNCARLHVCVQQVSERLFHLAYAQWLEELLGSTNQDKEDQGECLNLSFKT